MEKRDHVRNMKYRSELKMDNKPMLVVMLTCDDQTVSNAYEIFDKCKDTKAEYWGFKEKPLPLEEMKKLYAYMKK